MTVPVYVIPSIGGDLGARLACLLDELDCEIAVDAADRHLASLTFDEQIEAVLSQLSEHCQSSKWRAIFTSFGAYVFLHAQAKLPPMKGKVLLLSPILGEYTDENTFARVEPPHSKQLMALARSGAFPKLRNCEIFVGSKDWQSSRELVAEYSGLLGTKLTIVSDLDHKLDRDSLRYCLQNWIAS